MFVDHLECSECGFYASARELQSSCKECGRPLVAKLDLAAARRALDRDALRARPRGLWRFRELLPLAAGAEPVTLGEGDTPLLALPRLGADLGLSSLWVKNEAINPTGSFKDRGMSVAVSMARGFGVRTVAAPSAGNAGGSLAAYAARAGLDAVIAMPHDVPRANRREAKACGARIELVGATIADCGAWIHERAVRRGWFELSTLREPYRVEGKKTMGYEVAESFGWTLPDVILYPTGGGTGLVGMAKAFDEMRELGWIDASARTPRFVAVQAEGCAPIVAAFHAGLEEAEAPAFPRTIAAGLRVPKPAGDRWMLRILKESGGTAVAVSDEEILRGGVRLARREGIFPAPEGGALVAALDMLLSTGDIAPSDRVVLFVTGAGLKYDEVWSKVVP